MSRKPTTNTHGLKTRLKIKYVEEAFYAFLKFHTRRMSDEEISSKSITMDKFREWIQALLYYLPNARYIKTDEYSRGEYEDIMKIISRRQIQRERMDSEHQTKQKKYRYVKD